MNAGAFGEETWRHVVTVETIDRPGGAASARLTNTMFPIDALSVARWMPMRRANGFCR